MAEKRVELERLASSLVAIKWTIVGIALLMLLKNLLSTKRQRTRRKLPGKVVVITGANSGIGFATAMEFARRRARVVLACRRDGQRTAARIRRAADNNDVVWRQLDLSCCDSVRRFARDVLTSERRLHVLVNNAGVMTPPDRHTRDGRDTQLAVNYLGHFLLTNLLLNLLKKSDGKILNLTSHTYMRATHVDLTDPRPCDPWVAHHRSKLAVVMSTRELSRRLRGTNVTANVIDPGTTNTSLRRHTWLGFPPLRYFLVPVTWALWQTPEHVGQSIANLLASRALDEHSGQYFADGKIQHIAEHALNENAAKQLWENSVKLVGLQENAVL